MGGCLIDGGAPGRGWAAGAAATAAAIIVLCLVALVIAGGVIDRFWLLYLIWPAGVLGAAWLAVLGYGRFRGYRVRRYVLAPVIAVAITGAAAATGLPAAANLWLSRGALEQAGRGCADSGQARWIGGLRVEQVARGADGACFFTTGGLVDQAGWVYAPGGTPTAPDDRYTLRHHSGDWYRFDRRF